MAMTEGILALTMLEAGSPVLEAARAATKATGAPVVGGVAVHLHGYPRSTRDVDLFANDPKAVAAALTGAGAEWVARRREFLLDGVAVQLVTLDQTGAAPARVSTISGVRVVSLADLIRFKLHSGLGNLNRAQDVADVVELIRRVPLDKRFAAKLPREQRADFKKLVEAVRIGEGKRGGRVR